MITVTFYPCHSLITGCCYKFLENPTTVKNGTTKELIFNLLGVMVKKYNYGLGKRSLLLFLTAMPCQYGCTVINMQTV